ncbi:MAG: NAD-dependent epimerase/dehydratase family protein [Actinomycetota bacterium]
MASPLERPLVLGAGPVGHAVTVALVRRGARPTVVTRRGTTVPGADAVAADVADPVQAKSALAEATAVFQCAQPAYHRWPEDFPPLQRSILDACEAAGATLVATENLYGYGPVDVPMTEDTPMRATTRKGRVRAAMWEELAEAHAVGRTPTAAVRASDFFGPGVLLSSHGERYFPRLLAGRKAEILGDPSKLHSVTYVPDLGDAMVRVAEDPSAWGRAWHAPTAPALTQLDLLEIAAAAAGTTPRHTVIGPWLLRLVGTFNRDVREMTELTYEFEEDFVVDSSAFTSHFGVAATPLADALAETVAWFRSEAS